MKEKAPKKEWNANNAFDCLAVTSVQVFPFKEGGEYGPYQGPGLGCP